MQVYRVELLVIDHENLGADAIGDVLNNTRYISASVMAIQGADIGEWDDSNPLNHGDTQESEFRRLFPSPPPGQ